MPFTYDETGALLVSGPIGGSGAATRVAFWTAAQTLGSSADLYWDNVTSALGIKDTTPQGGLDSGGIGAGAISGEVNATVDHATAYSATAQSAALEPCFAGQNKNAAADFSSIKLTTRQTNATRWEIFNIWSGTNYQGHLTFVTRTGAAAFAERMRLQNDGYLALYTTSPDRRLHAVDDDGDGSVIVPVARIESQVSGGAGAAGHGPGFEYYGESSTTENTFMAEIAARWSVATHASRRSRIEMYAAYQANEVLCGVIEAPFTGSADGNSRGIGAVDLQGWRSNVTDVASGNFAVLVGGQGSEASGVRSSVLGGAQANADKYGQFAHAAGSFGGVGVGDAQFSRYIARRDIATHVDGTWYSLWLDESSEQMTIDASTAWSIEVMVIGITANSAEQWGYLLYGLIERDNAGNTTMAAAGKAQTIFESDANYDANLVADNVNEALEVQVRRVGGVDYSIRWVAVIRTAECTHT